MVVMVTGGLGVNGSWVMKRLVNEGVRPVCFDCSTDTSLISDIKHRVVLVDGDTTDLSRLKEVIKRHEIDSIIHLAGLVSTIVSSLDPRTVDPTKGFEVNGRGTFNVLEAARLADVENVVYTSTKGVYASPTGAHAAPKYKPVDESYPTVPKTMYDATKLLGEHLGIVYHNTYGLPFVALRFSHIYGPGKLYRYGANDFSVYDLIVENSLKGVATRTERSADSRNDLIYVSDVGKAHVCAWKAGKTNHRVYNFSSGKSVSMSEFVDAVRRLIPKAEVTMGSKLYEGGFTLDGTLAREELGFEPDFTVKTGVADYVRRTTAK